MSIGFITCIDGNVKPYEEDHAQFWPLPTSAEEVLVHRWLLHTENGQWAISTRGGELAWANDVEITAPEGLTLLKSNGYTEDAERHGHTGLTSL